MLRRKESTDGTIKTVIVFTVATLSVRLWPNASFTTFGTSKSAVVNKLSSATFHARKEKAFILTTNAVAIQIAKSKSWSTNATMRSPCRTDYGATKDNALIPVVSFGMLRDVCVCLESAA